MFIFKGEESKRGLVFEKFLEKKSRGLCKTDWMNCNNDKMLTIESNYNLRFLKLATNSYAHTDSIYNSYFFYETDHGTKH